VLAFALSTDPLPRPPEGTSASRAAAEVDDDDDDIPARRTITSTLLPATAAVLAALVVGSTIAFAVAEDLDVVDALYFTVATAWGSGSFDGDPAWEKVLGLVLMVGAGALVGVLFSHLAAIATAERLDLRMERRASGLRGHVVVAGLGTIGYRVLRLLDELDVPVVAIEQAATSRFAAAGAAHGPVLTGDARLPEDLARTGIALASCLIAATDDDLVNVSACVQAKAVNPTIRTVARIFDETLADHLGEALGVDVVVSASRVAAAAFVGAALDERAPRHVEFHGQRLVAFRHDFGTDAPPATAHVLAADGPMAVVCGPADDPEVAALLHQPRNRRW
jgi:Trk K+ transport system NAD-binding subunit